MYKYKCLNPIAKFGLNHFTREYKEVEELFENKQFMENRWEYIRDIIKDFIA